MKLYPEDIAFSKVIREASGWHCQACQRYFPEGARQALHCSHVVTRSKRSTRWHTLAAHAHCATCHQNFGNNPLLHADWVREHRGEEVYNEIIRLGNITLKSLKKEDKKQIAREYRDQLVFMQDLRTQGVQGFIEPECSPTVLRLIDENG